MANQRTFGRRSGPQSQPIAVRRTAEIAVPKTPVEISDAPIRQPVAPSAETQGPSVDDELREWKRARKGIVIPWRPLSLMASLCFGIASFVLPDWMNSAVQWPLYGLSAASLYVWFAKRKDAKA